MKIEICEHCGKPGDYPTCDAPRKCRRSPIIELESNVKALKHDLDQAINGRNSEIRARMEVEASLTASEARVKKLEMALRDCINAINDDMNSMRGIPDEVADRLRKQARSALGDVTATKGEAK